MAQRTECLYGESGTGKSEAIVKIIEHIATTTGKTARVLIGDGSKASYIDSGLVDAGIVEIVDYTTRDWPMSTMQLLTEGYWPEDVNDPSSKLIAPDWTVLKGIGVYAIEGISVAGNYIMGDNKGGLSQRSGAGEKIGQDSPIRVGDGTYVVEKGKEVFKPAFEGAKEFGANPISHYNVAQRRILTLIDRSKVLPVDMVIWTAHQRAVEDKLSKEIVAGPEAPGGAITTGLQRIFNNTWHFTHASKRVTGQKDKHTGKTYDGLDVEYRVYTRDHYDNSGTFKFKAVTRGIPADELPPYLTGKPGEAVMELYSRIAKHREERMAKTKAAFEAVRGKVA